MIRFCQLTFLFFPLLIFANSLKATSIKGDSLSDSVRIINDTTRRQLSLNSQLPYDSGQRVRFEPYKIYDINDEIEKAEKKFNRMKYSLSSDASVTRINIEFRAYQKTLKKEFQEVSQYKLSHYSKFVLDNTYFIWSDFNMKLEDWQSKVNYKIKNNRIHINDLEEMEQRWKLTIESQKEIRDSKHINSRIQTVIEQIGQLKTIFHQREIELITLENEIAHESSFCTNIVDDVLLLKENLRDSIFYATSPALWNASQESGHYFDVENKFYTFWQRSAKTVNVYWHSENKSLILVFFVLCFLLVYSIKFGFSRFHITDTDDLEKKGIQKILFDYPILAAITLFLISYRLFFSYHPLIIGKITVLFLLITSQFLLHGFKDKDNHGKRFFTGIVILLTLNYLQIVFWYFGYLSRYYILIEQIIGLIISSYYLTPRFWKQVPPDYKLLRIAGILYVILFVCYFIALFCNLFGYFDLNILLLKVGIHIPVYTIIFFGIYKIWIALTGATLLIAKARKQTYLTHYWEKIEMRILKIVRIILIVLWLYSIIILFELGLPTYLLISEFMLKEHTIGTLHITLWAVIGFILIIIITFLLTGIIKFIVDDEFIKRSKLPRGVAHAISVSIIYILVFVGLMLAISTAGIDLGKFSLLAGALGVGIGFGLQNIVNNFISGLILIYERPLQVGDTIEIESLLGQVTSIGPRSSHVITYDGAEVVVPNGNLISNQLINWTLSDNMRRLEVKVGTAYGSDPNIVLKILEDVAKENPNILTEPPPLALFEGFGDSSLNFRLLFWIPFDISFQAKSDVSLAIYNKFKENRIEIPFPQLDLHVKDKPSES